MSNKIDDPEIVCLKLTCIGGMASSLAIGKTTAKVKEVLTSNKLIQGMTKGNASRMNNIVNEIVPKMVIKMKRLIVEDEIKREQKHRKQIEDELKKTPEKAIIIQMTEEEAKRAGAKIENAEWSEISIYSIRIKGQCDIARNVSGKTTIRGILNSFRPSIKRRDDDLIEIAIQHWYNARASFRIWAEMTVNSLEPAIIMASTKTTETIAKKMAAELAQYIEKKEEEARQQAVKDAEKERREEEYREIKREREEKENYKIYRKICNECGNEYDQRKSNAKFSGNYCDRSCEKKGNEKKMCQKCYVKFLYTGENCHNEGFCSVDCYNAYYRSTYKDERMKCIRCKNSYASYGSFCGPSCEQMFYFERGLK